MSSTGKSDPAAVAEAGKLIYEKNFKGEYETAHRGKFVVIDVQSQKAYLGKSSLEAYQLARQDAPTGLFHLLKIGARAAFKVNFNSHAHYDWMGGRQSHADR